MSAAGIVDSKYQIMRQLGGGAMGAVYEARHLGTGRRVALKVILAEQLQQADAVARFQREARAAGAIESRHIAQVLDTGIDPQTHNPYLVIEYLSGEDLQHAIARLGPLHPDLALRVVAQACLGLQKAHEARVVHRDVKPANVFLATQDGGEIVVKLLDFGIAKTDVDHLTTENAALTRSGAVLGSPLYMSPEQVRGARNVDHRTDVWSLGMVLYESLAGVTPFGDRDTLGALILAIGSEAARPVQDLARWVAPEIAAIVHRAIAKDARLRFSSAKEMFDAARALLPGGYAIHESMLVPAPPQLRGYTAPRLSLAASAPMSDTVAAADTVASLPPSAVSPAYASSAAGVAGSVGASPRPRSALPLVLSAAALLGAGALAAYRFLPGKVAPAPAAAAEAAPATASLPPFDPAPPKAGTVQLAAAQPAASAQGDAAILEPPVKPSTPTPGARPAAPGTTPRQLAAAGSPGKPSPAAAAPPAAAPSPSPRPPPPPSPPANTGGVDRVFQ